ncbi:MAG TPA: phosphomannomutase/phosphoglucomutase [Aigarchaeota archaeon]|nr:phosphomannomutase/phosphoglucomutase [Aigarchaeota archaeon]
MPEHIFRAYDVRGVYGHDLSDEVAYLIGRAFGAYLGSRGRVLVTRDVRLSGPQLSKSLVDGLTESGVDVLLGGVATTPMCYFGVEHYKADGGVSVTASHNPPEWNGFKMILKGGETISAGAGMEEIKDMVLNRRFKTPDGRGSVEEVKLADSYVEFMKGRFGEMQGLKVAVDYSDGASVFVVPRIFSGLRVEVVGINDNPDGYFRGHPPEPNEETLKPLQRLVVEMGCDFGVGFDGDADRAVFIDDRGRLLEGDVTLAVFVKHWPKKGKVIYDVNSSTALREVAERHGFQPVEWRVGRAFILRKVREEAAVLGGEKSNHLYFGELNGLDDAVYAALVMARIIHESGRRLSEVVDEIPRYPTTPILTYGFPDELKFRAIDYIAERLGAMGYRISRLDGVKAYADDGWVLVRASNTMPQVKMSVEAKTPERLEELKKLGEKLIEEARMGMKTGG